MLRSPNMASNSSLKVFPSMNLDERMGKSPTTFESSSDEGSSSEEYMSQEDPRPSCPTELKLRNYQKELAKFANEGLNTIICAPTGSGKTRVATYVIQEHFKNQDGTKAAKVAFLAGVVSLAEQQYRSLRKYLPSLKIALITGSTNNTMSLHLLLHDYDIFVMTPMILENHLRSKLLPNLAVFSMLVFDECHHTRKGEPYNTLMGSYHKTKNQIFQAASSHLDIKLPQIVGLTASIGIEGAEDLEIAKHNILKVCANLDAEKISTIKDHVHELNNSVPVPREETRALTEREDDETVFAIMNIMTKLELYMEQYAKELQTVKLDEEINKRPSNRKSQEYEQWAISTKKAAEEVSINKSHSGRDKCVRLIIITAWYLKEYRLALETFDLVELEDVMGYLEKRFQDLEKNRMRIKEENNFYNFFIGTSLAKQEDIIQRFRNGEIRLLVSTSVAEEGLDIPECNLVIKYNHVGNEISTVQTRGRSRALNGVSVLLGIQNVLLRESMNRKRTELMKNAIESIRRMPLKEFQAAIDRHQKDMFESLLSTALAQQAERRELVQPFEIVCSLCRKVSVCNTEMRTIYHKHRVSIDENLLQRIKIVSMPPKPMDELYFVGKVKCMGEADIENDPGKKCFNPLGCMIKYKDVPFVAIGINNVVFKTDNQSENRKYKQWKKVPFPIDEITDDDMIRYAPLLTTALKSFKVDTTGHNNPSALLQNGREITLVNDNALASSAVREAIIEVTEKSIEDTENTTSTKQSLISPPATPKRNTTQIPDREDKDELQLSTTIPPLPARGETGETPVKLLTQQMTALAATPDTVERKQKQQAEHSFIKHADSRAFRQSSPSPMTRTQQPLNQEKQVTLRRKKVSPAPSQPITMEDNAPAMFPAMFPAMTDDKYSSQPERLRKRSERSPVNESTFQEDSQKRQKLDDSTEVLTQTVKTSQAVIPPSNFANEID